MAYDVPSHDLNKDSCHSVTLHRAEHLTVSILLRDPIACLSEVCDAHYSTRQLAQATLRNTIGTRTLAQIMADQDGIASQVGQILDRATAVWGIRVEKVVIKDIRFPRELCRAMVAEAEAVRAAKAKMIFALGELSVIDFITS
ncbi:hypothetical protein OSTOST_20998 [Ostertagia ostertagi]